MQWSKPRARATHGHEIRRLGKIIVPTHGVAFKIGISFTVNKRGKRTYNGECKAKNANQNNMPT